MFRPRFCNQMLCTNISSSTFFSPSLSKPLCNYVLFGMHVVQTIGWILIKHTVSPSHILFDFLFRSFFIICQYRKSNIVCSTQQDFFDILCNYVFTALFIIDQPLLLFDAPMKILFYQYVLIFNNEPMLFLSSANIFSNSKVHITKHVFTLSFEVL